MTYKRVSTKARYEPVPKNAKIADITHADTNKHTLDLAAALSETRKIISVLIGPQRIGGTGFFRMYPNEGAMGLPNWAYGGSSMFYNIIIADATNRLQYDLSVANDDFDVYCYGYVVEA